jgi:predicted transcriptional regulator
LRDEGARIVGYFDEPEEEQTQRRSKTEMVCDVMVAISKGAVRPTKIMHRANLTWNALLMYLNALAVNGLIRREARGSISSYHLTEKGKSALEKYVSLREELGPLHLEAIDTKRLVEVMKAPTGVLPVEEKEKISAELRGAGYKILPGAVRGKSGVEHEFLVVAQDRKGSLLGYVFYSKPEENDILSLFVRQMDTDLKVHVVYSEEPTGSALARAREYGIDLVKLGSLGAPPRRAGQRSPDLF